MPIITLTTDFGTQDGYVGAVKGVILSMAPAVTIVDVAHDVPPHDVQVAAFVVAQAAPFFPDGTVHVVVVDPGVGGARAGVVIDDGRQRYVGPDNGVFGLAVPEPRAVHEITAQAFRRGTVSATFHGRDVFAPAAARLALGARVEDAGPKTALKVAVREGFGRVVHVDRFGNLVTDIPAARLPDKSRVTVGRLRLTALSRTYEDVARGKPLAYVGSAGTLEIAVREGSAAKRYGIKRGTKVLVR
jgi:S-adenosyl-L-methionine hydrolase (adenosine-forming)